MFNAHSRCQNDMPIVDEQSTPAFPQVQEQQTIQMLPRNPFDIRSNNICPYPELRHVDQNQTQQGAINPLHNQMWYPMGQQHQQYFQDTFQQTQGFVNNPFCSQQNLFAQTQQQQESLLNHLNNNQNRMNGLMQNQMAFQLDQQLFKTNDKKPNDQRKHPRTNQQFLAEEFFEPKIWFKVQVEIGAIKRELDTVLNSYQQSNNTVQNLKKDLVCQLIYMGQISSSDLQIYTDQSNLFYKGTMLTRGSLEMALCQVQWNKSTPIELRFVLAKCLVKLTKRGYWTFPKFHDLQRMTEEDLQRLDGFQIGNSLGTIAWPGQTDISYIDLDEIVEITQFDAEVYSKQPTLSKPKVGDKLNKPCFCEFKITYDSLARDWGCKSIRDSECFLSRKFEEKQMMFIQNDSNSGTIIMGKEIPHFSISELAAKDV